MSLMVSRSLRYRCIMVCGIYGFAVCVLTACGCATSATVRDQEPVDLPAAYADVPVEGRQAKGLAVEMDSPELADLLDRAFAGNMSLQMAWTRIHQAQAAEREAQAARLPLVPLRAGATRTRAPLFLPGLDSPMNEDAPFGARSGIEFELDFDDIRRTAILRNQYEVSLGAQYEVDLWGRLRHQVRAAVLDAAAAQRDADALAITLAAEVTEEWAALGAVQERRALLNEQIEVSSELLELLRLRFERGVVPVSEVLRQEQQVSDLQALAVRMQARMIRTANRLAILLGEAPRSEVFVRQSTLPTPPAVPAVGVPSALLDRRPDVRASRLRLEAADASAATAVAARLPSLRLTASLFEQTWELGDLFRQLFWSIGASSEVDVFDGGRRRALIERTEAVAQEAFFSYGQTLLQALQEVQDALTLGQQQEDYISHLEDQLATARADLELTQFRYAAGDADYLNYLMALQITHRVQADILEARRELFSLRIQLWRAIGGGWSAEDRT